MRGVPAIAANPIEDPRLLRFWIKSPKHQPRIDPTNLSLARARNSGKTAPRGQAADSLIHAVPCEHAVSNPENKRA
jgi:hypothetical protein